MSKDKEMKMAVNGIHMENENKMTDYEAKKEKIIKKYTRVSPGGPEGPGGPGRGPGGPGPGGPRGMRASGKPKNLKGSIVRILQYIKRDVPKLVIAGICVIVSNISALLATYQLRPVINTLGEKGMSSEQKVELLIKLLFTMAILYMVGIVASYIQQRVMIRISQNALAAIRSDLYKKLQRLPISYHDSNTTGELMSRFTNDVDAIGEMLNNTIIQLVASIVTVIGTLIMMFKVSIPLSIITLVTMPILTKLGGTIAKYSRKFYKGQQASLGAVNGYIEETVTGQKVVKVFCHEEEAKEEFGILSDELRRNQINAQFVGGIMGPVMGNLSQISFAITATIGGVLCVTSGFDVGGLTLFTNCSRQFSRPINELSMQVNTIFSALAGAERVFEIMNQEPEKDYEGAKYQVYTMDELEKIAKLVGMPEDIKELQDKIKYLREKNMLLISGKVQLKNVTFGYIPEKTILKNIDVVAEPGQKIAFVGSTGAGKTTITNLINRFYDIDEGSIEIDGVNIREIKSQSLREHMAMVLQDTHLFTGTVRENIRYGRLEATDEEVEQAAKTASAHSFIMRLEHGYDTMLEGDGANLSQGQRQLLNIARAAISKAPILILDEATSSVDTRIEKHIEHGMDRLMKSRTTFVIAHRLSTVRNSDCIIVLEQGCIVEQGTHEELLELKGRYHQLYTGLAELD